MKTLRNALTAKREESAGRCIRPAPFLSVQKDRGGIALKFSTSLKLNHIFRRLYHTNGQANACLVLYARKNRTNTNRVGVTVSKKLGKAVVRNRVRRRIREAYRINEAQFQPGWDIVIVARSRAVDVSFQKLTQSLLSLSEQAGILIRS